MIKKRNKLLSGLPVLALMDGAENRRRAKRRERERKETAVEGEEKRPRPTLAPHLSSEFPFSPVHLNHKTPGPSLASPSELAAIVS